MRLGLGLGLGKAGGTMSGVFGGATPRLITIQGYVITIQGYAITI